MINQKLALSMLMNNQTIYYKLLKRFYEKYKDHPEILRNLFKTNDASFYRIVHDIKGISLNLGATKLFELSDLINSLYIQEEKIEEMILDNFIKEFNVVNKEIYKILKESQNEI